MLLKVINEKSKKAAVEYLEKLNLSKRYSIDIKVLREKRTVDQNRLYWLFLNCIMDETGENRDNLHEFFKFKFLGTTEKKVLGNVFHTANTSTSLDSKEFTDYIERVKQFASVELGILLPNPDDLRWEDFYNKYKNYI